ncbi:MAG TPA: 4-hydroxythreonine-4-phosphate dehydrogenase PdxA [Gammaproteobacteria bacterium]|nr:4-hydroxythreonine-4-phosphate dehydrogenase PdxA [Gammaproteobacteria bacterium]
MNQLPRISLTPGEPAGLGPDIVIQIAQHAWDAELIVIANDELLKNRAHELQLPLALVPFDAKLPIEKHQPGRLKILSVPLNHPVNPGELSIHNAAYVMQTLDMAADLCQKKITHAVVTGPVHKGILNEAGIVFSGHTEFFAEKAGCALPLMLFVTPETKVALATTHLALRDVPGAITSQKIKTVLRLLHTELQNKFNLPHPKMLVCGLNPHAGENGHLGREEIDIIAPALLELRKENINAVGPLSADTVFTHHGLQHADAVLAMYHDQALPVVKYMSFGRAVNVTLGLPYIRTSVDHGVALDVAGTGRSDPGSLMEALALAIKLL